MNKQDLKKYLTSYSPGIIGFIMLAISTVMFILLVGELPEADAIAFFLLLLIAMGLVGLFMIGACICDSIKLSKWLNEMEALGQLALVLEDFAGAQVFFKNELRLGNTYIFGKKSGKVYTYSYIARVYQGVHITNGVESGRDLRVGTRSGKTLVLCHIMTDVAAQIEIQTAMLIIATKDSSIIVGAP